MSSNRNTKPKFHQILSLALAALTIIFLVFYGSLPVSYDYEVGSIAGQDIYATRAFALCPGMHVSLSFPFLAE